MSGKTCILLIVLTHLWVVSHGQSKRNSWKGANHFELMANNPDSAYPPLIISIYPISGAITENYQLGGAISVAYRFKNKLDFALDFEHAYVDFSSGTPDFTNANTGHTVGFKTTPASHVQFRGEYNVLKKEKVREKERVHLGGMGRVNYYVGVEEPTNTLWMLNVRAGYGYRNGMAKLGSSFMDAFSGVNVSDATEPIQEFSGSSGTYTSMVGTHYMAVGIAFEVHKHIVVDIFKRNKKDPSMLKPLGTKTRHHVTKYYFDILVNLNSSIANMTVSNYDWVDQSEMVLTTYELDPHTSALPVGFRIGRMTNDFAGIVGLATGLEIGLPPGKGQMSALYFGLRAGLNIDIAFKKKS